MLPRPIMRPTRTVAPTKAARGCMQVLLKEIERRKIVMKDTGMDEFVRGKYRFGKLLGQGASPRAAPRRRAWRTT